MKRNKYKVMVTDFDRTKENYDVLKKISELIRLNILLEKNLISKIEYEKVKCAIGFSTHF